MKRDSQQGKTQVKTLSAAAVAFTMFTLLFSFAAVPAQAQIPTPTILYGFQQVPTDVIFPGGAIAQGRDGNLYGTGSSRGANSRGGVWKITPSGTETLLASFPSTYINCQGLTLAMDGNFYGVCTAGGASNFGLVYRVTPAGVLTDLHDFDNSANDYTPQASLALGPDSNLYGQTENGNAPNGTIYRITTAGVYKHLLSLSGGYSLPSTVHFGSDGNLYGTVQDAPTFGNRGGVFKLTTGGTIKTIYGFADPTGSFPNSGVIQATDGKLYGTTGFGAANGSGGIYKVATAGTGYTLLTNTNNATGPANSNDLLQASNGNFYGAALGGGSGNQGGLYELTSAGVFSSFLFTSNPVTGVQPSAPLIQHTNGTIFGTSSCGGPNASCGTFFSLNIGAAPFLSLVSPNPAGKLGYQIGILGQGFSSSSVVKFGGTTATTRTLTGTTFILATVPAGAHTGTVTVTTGSTTLTSLKTFKVTPAITSFTPASGHVAQLVTINGTGLIQATTVKFGSVKATTFTVVSDSQVTAVVPTLPLGAVTISITTPGGTANSPTKFTVN